MVRIGVIADDLTGANDAGLQFAKAGLETMVAVAGGDIISDVVVVNTQSRALPADEASRRAADAARRLDAVLLYKKMDSTARGPWGAELAAIMEITGRRLALVTPAFPAQGRTVVHGRVWVAGVPLEQSEFAGDPAFLLHTGDLAALLAAQGAGPVWHAGLELIERGPAALADYVRQVGAGVIICDAERGEHLQSIAGAAAVLRPAPLLCGSAGLAAAVPAAFGWPARAQRQAIRGAPVLIVAGSRHPATVRQCIAAEAAGAARFNLDPIALTDRPASPGQCRQAAAALAGGRDVILCLDPRAPAAAEKAEAIANGLAATALRVISDAGRPGALALSGGDVAYAFCRQADVWAMRLLDEILPGIPAGRLLGGLLDNMPAATKAGGFGASDAWVRVAQYFRGNSGEL